MNKNPNIVIILSFFITGLGQIYNGETVKGIAFFIIEIIFILLMSVWIGLILAPLFWIYAMHDAYKTAKK